MPDTSHVLDPDAQAIFLLCGRLGSNNDDSVKPLTLNQYNEVANWLNNQDMRPGDLLDKAGLEQLSIFGTSGALTEERLRSLLQRGTALAMAVEEWTNKGGWILARSDDAYPTRFRTRLRHLAPPVLYGVGDRTLLERGGISMVGSRDSDAASLAFVRDIARRCADEGVCVVSGGARGVDQASMDAALEAGGTVMGALANGLAKTSRKKKYREAITEGRLTLVSAYHPSSRFQVWKAMGRNKHIYTLGDATIVAHSAVGSGGTWAGATENLKYRWVPLLVRAEPPIPNGNRALIEQGGHPIDRRVLREDVQIAEWMQGTGSITDIEPATAQFSPRAASSSDADQRVEAKAGGKHHPEQEATTELFPLIWPALQRLLNEPQGEQDVRAYFDDLRLGQARDWLKKAVEQGLAVREERPVRYVLSDKGTADNHTANDGLEANETSDTEGGPAESQSKSAQDLFGER